MLGYTHSYLGLHEAIGSLWTTGYTRPKESDQCGQEVTVPLAQIPHGCLLTTLLYMSMQLGIWFSLTCLLFPSAVVVQNSLLGLEFLYLISETLFFSLAQG